MDYPLTSPPLAPPTSPGSILPPRPAWPTILGTIAILHACAGAALSVLMALLQSSRTGPIPADQALDATIHQQRQLAMATVVVGILMTGVALILLGGGVQLVLRRRRARPWLIFWASVRLAFGPALAALIYLANELDSRMGAAQGFPSGPGQLRAEIMLTIIVFLWMVAPALFILIWLTRPQIKLEISTWR